MDEERPLLINEGQPYLDVPVTKVVDFDPSGDPENPLDWSKSYRLGVVLLLALMAFTVTFTCIGIVPIAEQVIFDLEGKESKSASILLVTVWELGEAAGPLLIAPLSEIFGRYPVFNIANILFIFGVALAASSQTANLFIFSRLLTGFAVASNVLNPAIIGDIYPTESRGSGMSLVMLAPLLGGAIGPAVSGAIAETFGWRKIIYISLALAIVCEVAFFALLRETYKVAILQRKAGRLRKETGDYSLKCAWDTENAGSASWWSALRASFVRPVTVLLGSSVLQIMSFYGGFVFTFFYIFSTTLPGLLRDIYGFTPALTGSSFISFSIGATCGIIVCNLCLDNLYVMLGKSREGGARPEDRLPFLIGGAIFMPILVALYGWVPYARWSVYLLLIAVAFLGFTMMLIWVPLASYIVDAFGVYSASALTIALIYRCLAGTLLPLAIPPLTDTLGFGYGFMVLAGICALLIPLPIAVVHFGARWRQHSCFTKDVVI